VPVAPELPGDVPPTGTQRTPEAVGPPVVPEVAVPAPAAVPPVAPGVAAPVPPAVPGPTPAAPP
jgi:hypothetical protein